MVRKPKEKIRKARGWAITIEHTHLIHCGSSSVNVIANVNVICPNGWSLSLPWYTSYMVSRPFRTFGWIQLHVWIGLVQIPINQIDSYTQIMFRCTFYWTNRSVGDVLQIKRECRAVYCNILCSQSIPICRNDVWEKHKYKLVHLTLAGTFYSIIVSYTSSADAFERLLFDWTLRSNLRTRCVISILLLEKFFNRCRHRDRINYYILNVKQILTSKMLHFIF